MKKLILAILVTMWLAQPSLAAVVHKNASHKKKVVKHVVQQKTQRKAVAAKKTIVAKKHGKKNRRLAKHTKPVHKRIVLPNIQSAEKVEQATIEAKPSYGFMASMKQHVVQYVQKTVSTMRYSVYKMGGRKFDVSHGIYIVDCSDYVDNILEEVNPNAFSSLVNSTGSDRPTTEHYYDFFSGLDNGSNRYWSKVHDVDQLESGDVLVFRYKNSYGSSRGGHVMVVMDKPTEDGDGYLVRVADSAPSGHSEDTRRGRVSGIGIGTLVLKANPHTGQPSAYAWKIGAAWKSNVNIAMARPVSS